MKAVAYLRVSSQGQSLERQYDDIISFASAKGLNLVNIFDDKLSASVTKTDQRAGFNQMKKFIEVNEDVKNILILEISRLGRKSEIQSVVEDFTDKGINIHIKDINLSTLDKDGKSSLTAELLLPLLVTIAKTETRQLADRIKSGKMSRAKKNLAFGGKIIGYKKGEDGTPVIDEKEAPMIRRIFELASKNLGMRNVSTMIESEFGRKIAIGSLSGIVRNTFHKGERKYLDLELTVPAIVSKELWQKANDSIDSRHRFGSRAKANTNILHGRINCECGNVMHQKVISIGRMDCFICKDEKCKNSINRPWLFRMIRRVVERHALKTKDEQVRENFRLQILSYKKQIELNNKEIERLEKRQKRARNLYLDSEGEDEDQLKKEYDEVKADVTIEKKEYNDINNKLNEIIKTSEKALKTDIKHFSDDLELFKVEIKDIISNVVISKESVLINIFGWREYDLYKPNSTKLGWEARKPLNERYLDEGLPLRHHIDEENLEMMIDDFLSDK